MYIRWYGDLLWLFVPIQQQIKTFFGDYEKFPHQEGSSLNAAGINYKSLKAAEILKRLESGEPAVSPGD